MRDAASDCAAFTATKVAALTFCCAALVHLLTLSGKSVQSKQVSHGNWLRHESPRCRESLHRMCSKARCNVVGCGCSLLNQPAYVLSNKTKLFSKRIAPESSTNKAGHVWSQCGSAKTRNHPENKLTDDFPWIPLCEKCAVTGGYIW